jgi:hypothetical protein
MALSPCYTFLSRKVGIFKVNKESIGPSGNQALSHHSSSNQPSPVTREQQVYPVLHRTRIKVICYKSIELRQRVLYIKGLLVER